MLFRTKRRSLDALEPEEAAEELARRLAEYRRMKEAASWLPERLATERDRWYRVGPAALAPQPERRLASQDPTTLTNALQGWPCRRRPSPWATWRCASGPSPSSSSAFAPARRRRVFDFDSEVAGLSRVEQAVAFLALLELRKGGEIGLSQAAPFSPIGSPEPTTKG